MRLPATESKEFDEKLIGFFEEYQNLRKGPELTLKELVCLMTKHDLRKRGSLINNKNLSRLLAKHGIQSQKAWFNQALCDKYDSEISRFESGEITRSDLIKDLAQEFGRSRGAINSTLRNSGRSSSLNKNTKEKYKEVVELVRKGGDFSQAKDLWGRNNTSQLISFLKHELSLELSGDYFLTIKIVYRDLQILTTQNAHLWGLIYADGTVNSGSEVAIRLVYYDRDYLNEISKSLVRPESQGPSVSDVPTSNSKGRHSDEPCVNMTIARKSFTLFIIDSLGLPQNKETKEYGLPDCIKDACDPVFFSFLQGFFEGDGCPTENTKSPCIKFSVNITMGQDIQNEIHRRVGFSGSIRRDKSIYKLTYTGTPRVLALMLKIYSSDNIRMARKFDKSEECWAKWSKTQGITKDLEATLSEKLNATYDELRRRVRGLNYKVELINIETRERFSGGIEEFCELHKVPRTYIIRLISGAEKRKCTHQWMLERYSLPTVKEI